MITVLLLSCSLLTAGPAPEDRDAYEAANAQAGRDADAHVKLALWCEQHGMTAERARHLALAVLNDPKNAMARGLMGLVQFDGGWRRPDDVAARLKADADRAATVAEYNQKRLRAPHTADGQWKLALWCEENGLKPEATAHLWASLRLDPTREAAWKRLGYKKQGNRWVTDAQLAAEKEERSLQEQADKQWKPLVEKWNGWLKGKRHQEAEQAFAGITDPRAVPTVWAVLSRGGEDRQRLLVRTLGQIDAPAASQDLALLALFSPSPDVRRQAAETLDRRDMRDYGGVLIGFLRDPIKYTVRPVNGPGSRGEIFIEGKEANVKRRYSPAAAPTVSAQPDDTIGYDGNGLPVISRAGMRWEPVFFNAISDEQAQQWQAQGAGLAAQHLSQLLAQSGLSNAQSQQVGRAVGHNLQQSASSLPVVRGVLPGTMGFGGAVLTPAQTFVPVGAMIMEAQAAALAAQQQLANDVNAIERYNGPVKELNGRVTAILTRAAGQNLGADRESWQRWFVDLLGYAAQPQMASQEKPLVVEDVPLDVQPQSTAVTIGPGPQTAVVIGRHSCFGRGTPVRTLAGPRPIETIQPGDQVLTQDRKSGALTYQPVLRVAHNPPNKTFAIKLGSDTIVATGIHRFWKAGHGWVMARDLKPGDPVRTLGGVSTVTTVDEAPVQPVFNLEVASGQSFFVGDQGALVHDNSLVKPVPEPFDAPAQLTRAETDNP